MVDKDYPTEHNITRYVMLLLIDLFPLKIWNFVPQYYTQNGKWPDLALETYIRRPGKKRDPIFVPRVFLELKTQINTNDAIIQLIGSISDQYGPYFKSKGFLIGVKGTQWTILDYHLVLAQGNNNPQCLILNFYDAKDGNAVQPGRPTPYRQYQNFDFMDLKGEKDSRDLFKALRWIANQNEPRDLTSTRHHARPLPVSLTQSTLSSLGVKEEELEMSEEFRNEYAHLIPLLVTSDMGTGLMEMED
jgi:hypothetical protein